MSSESKRPPARSWNISKFTKPNGIFAKNHKNEITFIPNRLPPATALDNEFVMLLVQAERKVAELKGWGARLENPEILSLASIRREAVSSSRIEGTRASLADLNRHEAVGSTDKKNMHDLRLQEVLNYVSALEHALDRIRKGEDTSQQIIKDAHAILMRGIRGWDGNPGEFRTRQNYIVDALGTIAHTPPPPDAVQSLVRDLVEFLQGDPDDISALVQCAMAHYQFESIHPFGDGNGRIGRLLIPLVLYKKGILPVPLLCLSSYFEEHRREYYDGLMGVSREGRWDEWIKLFLKAFAEQSHDAIRRIGRLESLKREYVDRLGGTGRAGRAMILVEGLLANPYITVPRAAVLLNTTFPTAKKSILALASAGILEPAGPPGIPRVFVAREVADVLE